MMGNTFLLTFTFFTNSLSINVQLECVNEFLIFALNDSETFIELVCVHKS